MAGFVKNMLGRRAGGSADGADRFVDRDITGLYDDELEDGVIMVPPIPSQLAPDVVLEETAFPSFVKAAQDTGILTREQVHALRLARGRTGASLLEVAKRDLLLSDEQWAVITQKLSIEIFVDTRVTGSPAFLTWTDDIRRLGGMPKINKCAASSLAAERTARANVRVREDERHLENLAKGRRLFLDAAAYGATDVTILVRESHCEVQWRIKGDYMVVGGEYAMRREQGEDLVRAIYAGLCTVHDETYKPLDTQNGQMPGETIGFTGLSSIRVIRGPMYPEETSGYLIARLQYNGEKKNIARRPIPILRPASPNEPLSIKGFTPLQLSLCERLARFPAGVVLVTGPTGSGKTTTLFQLNKYQAQHYPTARQITIEKPPEIPQWWAIQLNAERTGFEQHLTRALRMDPDIIYVGEIRDPGEGIACMQAAQTGHFVWSTLHVYDAYKAMARLEGIDNIRLSKAQTCDHELIVGLMSIRLAKVLCHHCSVPLHRNRSVLPEYMVKNLKTWGDLSNVRVAPEDSVDCPHCLNTRILDREAVAEIVLTTEELMAGLRDDGTTIKARTLHRKKTGSDLSLLGNAMAHVLTGRYSPVDVERDIHVIEDKGQHEGPDHEESA